MKNIIIEVPRSGASVQLVLRTGASSGQAVIVATDDIEIQLAKPVAAMTANPKSAPATNNGKTSAPKAPARDLDAILKRLLKLKPTKRVKVINSIKSMFQFDAPITDDEANKILEDLRKRGSLTIDTKDKIKFHKV